MSENDKAHKSLKYNLPDGLPAPYCKKGHELELFKLLNLGNGKQRKAIVASRAVKDFLREHPRPRHEKYSTSDKLKDFYSSHIERYNLYVSYIEKVALAKNDKKDFNHYDSFEHLALSTISPNYFEQELEDADIDRILDKAPGCDDQDILLDPLNDNSRLYAAQAYGILNTLNTEIRKLNSRTRDEQQAIVNALFSVASLNNDKRIISQAIEKQPALSGYFDELLAHPSALAPDDDGRKQEELAIEQEHEGHFNEVKVSLDNHNLVASECIQNLKTLSDQLCKNSKSMTLGDFRELQSITQALSKISHLLPGDNVEKDAFKYIFLQLIKLGKTELPWLDRDLVTKLFARWARITMDSTARKHSAYEVNKD